MTKLPSYLWRSRHGVYYYRKALPKALRPHFGGICEYRRSLRTDSHKTAVRLARQYTVAMEELMSDDHQTKVDMLHFIKKVESDTGTHAEEMVVDNPLIELQLAREFLTGDKNSVIIKGKKNKGTLLSELITKYCDEKTRLGKWSEKSEAENRAIYDLLVRIIGDKNLGEIGYPELNKFKTKLLKLPSNINKKPQYKELDIDSIIALKPTELLSQNTLNKYLTRTSSLFSWANRHGLVDKNYAEGLTVGKDKTPSAERDEFVLEDLQKIFNPDEYSKYKFSFQYWIPLIALFSGLRLEEICQLHTSDIKQINNIWCFDVNNENEKKIKTKSGIRFIPMHSKLIELGLLEAIEKIKAEGGTRLFPELKKGRDGYGARVSKWFGRYRVRVGIKQSGKVFHSFRHTFTTELKRMSTEEALTASLVGHTHPNITYARYGKNFTTEQLSTAVEKIDFEIDFPHQRI